MDPVQPHKESIDFLVVDDQDPMLQAIRNMLRQLFGGKKTVIARSGKEALKILKESNTKFLITDWTMPNLTGIELLKLVRRNPLLYETPVMLISDEMDKQKFLYAIEEGVDGYQMKPFTESKLMASVGCVVEARDNWTPLQKETSKLRRLMLLKKYEMVVEIGLKILKKVDSPDIMLMVSECYYNLQEYANSRKILKNIASDEKKGKALHLFGRSLLAEGKFDKALPCLMKSMSTNPLDYERKVDASRALVELGKQDQAAELLKSILHENPTDLSLVSAASVFLEKGNVKEASQYFAKCSNPIPETVASYNQFALELRKSGELEKSLKQYKKCLRVAPENEVIMFNYGRVFVEMGKPQKAREVFNDVLGLNPNNESAKKFIAYLDKQAANDTKKKKG